MSEQVADLFKRLTTGVYLIGVAAEDELNAFTAAWVMQVSFDPLLLALSINPNHSSFKLMQKGGGFTVTVLKADQGEIAARYGDPAREDWLSQSEWVMGPSGLPQFRDGLAYFECELKATHKAGDHVLAVGKVSGAGLLDSEAAPLLYGETGDIDGAAALYPKEI